MEIGSPIQFNQTGRLDAWFLCNHTSPSKWVANVEYINDGVEVVAYTIRQATNYSDPNSFRYISVIRMTKDISEVKTVVLHCEEVECPRIRQTLVLTTDGKSGQAELLTFEQEVNSTEVHAFDSKRDQFASLDNNETCPFNLTLFYDSKNGKILYKWSHASAYITPVTVKSAMAFENAHRFTSPLNKECVEYETGDLKAQNITCSGCDPIHPTKHNRLPMVFLNSFNGIDRVFKSYFDLKGKLYFVPSPPLTDPKIQVSMQIEKKLYRGQNISVKCHAVAFKFSYGFVVTWNIAGESKLRDIIYLSDDDSDISDRGSLSTSTVINTDREFLDESSDTNIEISVFAPVWNSKEWVSRSFPRTLLASRKPSVNISRLMSPNSDPIRTEENITIICTATGLPLPNSLEFIPSTNFSYEVQDLFVEDDLLTLVIDIQFANEYVNGKHKCIARSLVGMAEKDLDIHVVDPGSGFPVAYKYALIALGIVLFVFASVSAILLIEYRQERKEFMQATEETIKRFHDGFIGKTAVDFNSNHEYRDFELPLVNWGMGGTMLGSGAFGVVQKGFIQRGRSKTVVAIKTVNAPKEVEDFESSLMELVIMSYIGHHEHVVSLVASCTDNLKRRSLLIGVEYCSNGDLLSYIHKRKSIFHNFVNENGYISLVKISRPYDESYTNMIATGSFSTVDLYRWAYQIAKGMDFLASKKVLHADLAARNILLTEDNTAKVSDFGLSRQLMESDTYTKKTNVPLPWRWMSLEALRFRKFSPQSDVWSYGVLLFELFTLGDIPWPGLGWTHEFSDELEKGRRLARPLYGTVAMYDKIMLECWRNEPGERVSFDECRQFFETALAKLNATEGKDDEWVMSC